MADAAPKPEPLKDLARRFAPALAVGGAIVASSSGILNFDLPPWAIDMLKQWGPAGVLFIGVAYYIPRGIVKDFIIAHQAQAVAMGKIGDQLQVLTGESGKLDEIKSMLQESHLNLMVITDRIMAIEGKLVNVIRTNDTP